MKHILILLAFLAWGAGPSWALDYAGDLSTFPEGSDGYPDWLTTGVGWDISNNAWVGSDSSLSMALLWRCPESRRISVDASVEAVEPIGPYWKVAGLTAYCDRQNYWQLALVETPPEEGGRHFIELKLMAGGSWGAEAARGFKLGERLGTDHHWRYGRPYLMKLEVTELKVQGLVMDSAGSTVCRIGYELDPPSGTWWRPGICNGGLRSRFSNFRATADTAGQPPRPKTGPWPDPSLLGALCYPDVTGRATGFFHMEKQRGRDWLIAPNGQGFLVKGCELVDYEWVWCQALGYAPYHRNIERIFGSEQAWASDAYRKLSDWGFNTVGQAGQQDKIVKQGLAYIPLLRMGQRFARLRPLVEQTWWTGFPDVFDPKFAAYCRGLAEELCRPYRDDPWLVGYCIDNELEWFGKAHVPWALFAEAMARPASSHAKQAAVAGLRSRYGGIGAFNRVWGTAFGSWDSLLLSKYSAVPTTARQLKDAEDFIAQCADRYFSITASAIREADPNHLVLGARFPNAAPEAFWRAAGRHCDAVTVNVYPRADLLRRALPGLVDLLMSWHRLAGKPLLITEWSFPALDAGLPCVHGAGMRVDDQRQRELCAALFVEVVSSLPFMVGTSYFTWADQPAQGISDSFPENCNYGLVDVDNRPYQLLTQSLSAANQAAERKHSGWRSSLISKTIETSLVGEIKGKNPVLLTRKGNSYTIDNGILRLTKSSNGGAIFDSVFYPGDPIGSYSPLVHISDSSDLWLAPDRISQITTKQLSGGGLRLTLTAERRAKSTGASFRITYRVLIPPGQPWFAVTASRFENLSGGQLSFRGYFHYIPSFIGREGGDDAVIKTQVPNYWLKYQAWYDSSSGLYYGAAALDNGDYVINFFRDHDGRQHPDIYIPVETVVKKKARLNLKSEYFVVFAGPAAGVGPPWRKAAESAYGWLNQEGALR